MASNADHPADRELLRAVLAGDAAAIESLVMRLGCIPRILALLNHRVGSVLGPEDLSDLTQDTLARLWTRMDRYDGQASLESWSYGFCFNGLMNALRKERRMQSMDVLPEHSVPGPSGPSHGLEYDLLEQGLERLGERDARVIRLKYFDDLTFDEIGARLGISPNTAKTCYYRGMRQLEVHLRRESGQARA